MEAESVYEPDNIETNYEFPHNIFLSLMSPPLPWVQI